MQQENQQNFFFLLHNFTDRRFVLTIDISKLGIQVFFFFLIKYRSFTFSLKGSTLKLLFGYLNCQHHHSCALGPFLSKIRVTWEFPGSPVVRTWRFHCCGPDLTPGWGTKILQGSRHNQKKKSYLNTRTAIPQQLIL